jgi:hypothetical protein
MPVLDVIKLSWRAVPLTAAKMWHGVKGLGEGIGDTRPTPSGEGATVTSINDGRTSTVYAPKGSGAHGITPPNFFKSADSRCSTILRILRAHAQLGKGR